MKRISLFSLSIVFLLCLNSCKNFFSGSGFIMELEDSIEYNNLPVLNIELKSPPEKMGSISPTGNVSYKKKDSFEITFTKTQYCDFNGWVVLNGEEPSDAIEFTVLSNDDNAGVYKAKATIKESIDNLVVIPTYTEHFFINEQFPDNPRLVYPANSVVELKFNYPLSETANFKDYFTLKFADEDFSSYYEIRFSEDKKEVSLVPYAEGLVNYMKAKDISSLIMNFALSENFFTTVGEGDDAKEFPLVLDEKYKFTYMINTDVDSIKPTTTSFSAYRKYDDSYENELSVLSTTDLGANNHLKNTVKIKADFADDDSGVKYVLIRDTLTNTVDGTATNNTPTEEWTKISENFTDFEYELKASQNGLVKIEFAPVDYSGNRGEIQSFEVVRDVKTEISDLKVYNFEYKQHPTMGWLGAYTFFDNVHVKADSIFSNYYLEKSEHSDFYTITTSNNDEVSFYGEEKLWTFVASNTGSEFEIIYSDKIGNKISKTYIVPAKPVIKGPFFDTGIIVDYYIYTIDGDAYQKESVASSLVKTNGNTAIRTIKGNLCSVSSDENTLVLSMHQDSTTDFSISTQYSKGSPESKKMDITFTLENANELWNKYEEIWVSVSEGSDSTYFIFEKNHKTCTATIKTTYGPWGNSKRVIFYGRKDSSTTEVFKQEIYIPKLETIPSYIEFDNNPPYISKKTESFSYDKQYNDYGRFIFPFTYCRDSESGIKSIYTWTNECDFKVSHNPTGQNVIVDIDNTLKMLVNDFEGDENDQVELYCEITDKNNNSTKCQRTLNFHNIPAFTIDEITWNSNGSLFQVYTEIYVPPLYNIEVYLLKLTDSPGVWELVHTFSGEEIESVEEQNGEDYLYFYYLENADRTYPYRTVANGEIYKVITKANRDSVTKIDEFGYSDSMYFMTKTNNPEDDEYFEHPEKTDYFISGDNGVLVNSKYPVLIYTVATSKPYSECKDWSVEKWNHRRQQLNETKLNCSEASGLLFYEIPLSQIQEGQCYTTFIYYASDIIKQTPVKQK